MCKRTHFAFSNNFLGSKFGITLLLYPGITVILVLQWILAIIDELKTVIFFGFTAVVHGIAGVEQHFNQTVKLFGQSSENDINKSTEIFLKWRIKPNFAPAQDRDKG